jgi:hypothetical protein
MSAIGKDHPPTGGSLGHVIPRLSKKKDSEIPLFAASLAGLNDGAGFYHDQQVQTRPTGRI